MIGHTQTIISVDDLTIDHVVCLDYGIKFDVKYSVYMIHNRIDV